MFKRLVSLSDPKRMLTDTANAIDETLRLDNAYLGMLEIKFEICN
jgi:hypothetical protein